MAEINKYEKMLKDIYYGIYYINQANNERPHKKPRVESDYFLDVNSIYIENTNTK